MLPFFVLILCSHDLVTMALIFDDLTFTQDVNVKSVHSGPVSCHTFAVTKDGRVFAWGRNEKSQLGLGHQKDVYCPKLIDELTGHKIVSAAVGRNHSLFLTGKDKDLQL